jgi:hypothetical protein
VKRLGTLFARARKTLVWLGPERDDSEKAFELLQILSDCLRDAKISEFFHPGSSYVGTGCFRAIYHLLWRSYWDRVWVLQELILSQEGASIMCGSRSFLMCDLVRPCYLMIRDTNFFLVLVQNELFNTQETVRAVIVSWITTVIKIAVLPSLRDTTRLDLVEMVKDFHSQNRQSRQS